MTTGPEPRLMLRTDSVATRNLGDETVVLDLKESRYLSTNATGTVLWGLLEAGTTRSALVDALVAEFDVERETASTDVDRFLADCRRRRLIDDTGGDGAG